MGKKIILLGPIPTFLQTEWKNLAETVPSFVENAFQTSQDFGGSLTITLNGIILELESRANLLQLYQLQEYRASPTVYCLSAFNNPHGFLAALIRETVQIKLP